MTKLIVLVLGFLAPIRPLVGRDRHRVVPALTRRAPSGKPLSHLMAEWAFDGIAEARRQGRRAVLELNVLMAACRAPTLDPPPPTPLLAADLAVARGVLPPPLRSRAAMAGLVTAATPLRDTVTRITSAIETGFRLRWPEPGHARMAANLFVASLALACAGVVGAVAVVSPQPVLRLDRSPEAATSPPGAGLGPAAVLPGPPLAAPSPTAPHAPAAAPAPEPPTVPSQRGALPAGKGMWLWQPERSDGGDPHAIVARARAAGLTHIYVRTGSSRMGFYAQDFLNAILPVAHANGIRVYGWDFPYFDAWGDDVHRALAAIHHTTPDGHRIDGFSADIETQSEGTRISPQHATAYGQALRGFVGPDYPLIATIPRPSPRLVAAGYPFAEIVAPFDGIAPMVYWMNRDPGTDVAGTLEFLSGFGKPVMPVGQAYDGGPEGGPPGVPSRAQLIRFMQVAEQMGAVSVSFWSWQAADQQAWDAIADAWEFRLPAGSPDALSPGVIRAYQSLLTSVGFGVPALNGVWDEGTTAAVAAYQRASRLPVTGIIDEATLAVLLTPFAAPLLPLG
jgi:hypothetical protein